MIPLPVAPLRGVSVLVTRPIAEAQRLARRIELCGGEAILFPVLAIEPIESAVEKHRYDWLIFTSVNAVRYGSTRVVHDEQTHIAAVGKSTSAALEAAKLRVDVVPEKDFTSEALLALPNFAEVANKKILIVKGVGGRDVLQATLIARGATVSILDVYRRVKPAIDAAAIRSLDERWQEGIDVVLLLSVETLQSLHSMLSESARELLYVTPFLAVSERIVTTARECGLRGEPVIARGADDDAVIGAIAAWHARAR